MKAEDFWEFEIEVENGYPRPGTGDKPGEYSYIRTSCGNYWYSTNPDLTHRYGASVRDVVRF